MPSRTLVTGATGTVGAYLVRELSKRGELTRAAVHSEARAWKIREANVELFEMDFSKTDTVDAALKGIERLYLLTPFAAGPYEIADYDERLRHHDFKGPGQTRPICRRIS